MKKQLITFTLAALIASACSDSDDEIVESTPGTFQITVTNNTEGQLMTPPVIAIHDPSVNLFAVGETASDPVRDIAETGNNAALVAFAGENTDTVSAAGVAGDGPFPAGDSVSATLTTTSAGQVLSVVNMVVCTNDGIAGVNSVALPEGTEPVVFTSIAYDAGTRENVADAESFFPPPCAGNDVVNEAPEEDPRAPIAEHPGQSGLANVPDGANWDFAQGVNVMTIEVVRN